MNSYGDSVTIEETPVGMVPEWLIEHMVNQAIDPRPRSNGGASKILILYSNEESRRESMTRLSDVGFAFDRTLHHTLESLKSSLMTDLRLPRKIALGPAFERVLHEYCALKASKLAFPLINPLPNMSWGPGKTAALSELHAFLAEEQAIDSWSGPGINSFTKILQDLEDKIGGTHPDFLTSRIINGISGGKSLFTLMDIDGIVMLDHAPSMSKSDVQLLLEISQIKPIHQLTYPGSYRLGHHGAQIEDRYPITSKEDLPSWVPEHRISKDKEDPVVERVLVNSEEQSFEAAIKISNSLMDKDDECTVLIIDPAFEENQLNWKKLVQNTGLPSTGIKRPITSSPIGHWLHELVNLGSGPNAFSMERIRLIALQESLNPFSLSSTDQEGSQKAPKPDIELLENIARSEHILGGQGALKRWLEALCRTPRNTEKIDSRQSTQWWMISLASSLSPLLDDSDRKLLSNEKLTKGCLSGQTLWVAPPLSTGDEWLESIIQNLDTTVQESFLDGNTLPPSSIVQSIINEHTKLRYLQHVVGQKPPKGGQDWVFELSAILKNAPLPVQSPGISSRLRILPPHAALGCTSDIVILTNASSSSWNLKSTKMPFIDEIERHQFGLLRPDMPIRDARHHLRHILNCGERAILIDSSIEKSLPLASPVEEIMHFCLKTTVFKEDYDNSGPRDERQDDGFRIREMMPPSKSPLNPSSITIPLDRELQRDRERRQPKKADEGGYLPSESRNRVLHFDNDDLTRRVPKAVEAPRFAEMWPVIGALSENGKKTPTIDPRPFIPTPTGSKISDARHGFLSGPEQIIGRWSPSRLQEWTRCPRRGWMTKGLRIRDEETQSEDLDPRTHGDLLHQIHHDLICDILSMKEGVERDISNRTREESTINLSKSGLSPEELMKKALECLDKLAPWLERSDGVSTYRLRMLTGMSRSDWRSWLANPTSIPLGGRIGELIRSELELLDTMPIALEWEISDGKPEGTEINLEPSDTSPHQDKLPSIYVNGKIDRVDLIAFDADSTIWVDEEGSSEVAPIRISSRKDWKPRRRVIIRDLKTSELSPEDRHKKGLLEELQLAIYARSWEECHPGDLVVGAGISTIGHLTSHFLETSSSYFPEAGNVSVGNISAVTGDLHRFPDESNDPSSDPFRAWLAQRLSVSLGVSKGAIEGRVHPTPSKSSCRYCPVSSICEVRVEEDY